MPHYLLASHSYACETAGYAIFLDLKNDKYTAVSPEDLGRVREAVEGWPSKPAETSETVTLTRAAMGPADERYRDNVAPSQEEDVIETLVTEGLLTLDRSNGKPAIPPDLEKPTISLWDFPRPWPRLNAKHVQNFVSAWAMTTLRLRVLPISHIVNRLRKGGSRGQAEGKSFEINEARQLTTIFFALQPAFYSAKDACLRNSLTLVEFLSKYDIYPTCVFGVKMNPFAAHAWVQHGAVVLSDPIEHIRTFTPIMLVPSASELAGFRVTKTRRGVYG